MAAYNTPSEPYSQPGTSMTGQSSSSSSSWMKYTNESGFFVNNAQLDAAERTLTHESRVVDYGNHLLEASEAPKESSEFSQYEGDVDESLFCDKVCELNYFYRLTRLQNEETNGKQYFGFELEFWPCNNPALKEIVWGHRMNNITEAKRSTFTAALVKLTSLIDAEERHGKCLNIGVVPPPHKYDSHQRFSARFDPKAEGYEMKSERYVKKSECSKPKPELNMIPERVYHNNLGNLKAESIPYSQNAPSRPTRTSNADPPALPPPPRRGEDGYRIAIPRGPSIILESRRRYNKGKRGGGKY